MRRQISKQKNCGYNGLEHKSSGTTHRITSLVQRCREPTHTLLLFSRSVLSNSLRPHGLQHARPPCPPLSPGVCSDSCPSSRWCHPTISSCRPLLLLPPIFPSIRVFSNELALHIMWSKYRSFSFSLSPSNEYSKLISFMIDLYVLLVVQETLKSLLQQAPQFESIIPSALSLLYGPTLTSIHDYWKNHSFNYMDLYCQSDVSAF